MTRYTKDEHSQSFPPDVDEFAPEFQRSLPNESRDAKIRRLQNEIRKRDEWILANERVRETCSEAIARHRRARELADLELASIERNGGH